VLTARDADVIKTYVRLGLGVGIVASMAVEQKDDEDLVHIDASDLFPAHTTWIGFRRGGLLRKYQLDFIQLFAPQLTRRLIERAAGASTQADVEQLTAGWKYHYAEPGRPAAKRTGPVAHMPHLRVIASASAVLRCHAS